MDGAARTALNDLANGERGIVSAITGEHGSLSRLAALGFSIGAEVRMLRNTRYGPMIVQVRNTHVALERDIAAGILMEGQDNGMPQPAH